MTTQQEQLEQPFDPALLGDDGNGHTIVPVAEVVGRLNRVLGVTGWSYEILSLKRDDLEPEWWVSTVRLTAEIDGKTTFRDGSGGGDTARKRKDPHEVVDVGNDVKSAVSSALKKAAWHMGVGLYLSRKESAVSHDARATVNLSELEALIIEAHSAGADFDEAKAREFAANSQGHADAAAAKLRQKIDDAKKVAA